MTLELEKEVILPSGLSGIIRRMKIKDHEILGSPRLARKGITLSRFLQSIWVETTDLGIYEESDCFKFKQSDSGTIIDWEQVLLGDRLLIMTEARKLRYGDEYIFDLPCPACERTITRLVKLSDMKVSGLSDEAYSHLRAGNMEFERTFPIEKVDFKFKLAQGVDEKNIAKAREKTKVKPSDEEQILTINILSRLSWISGCQSPKQRLDFVQDLFGDDADWLKEQFEETDISVDTKINIECVCGKTFEREAPFDENFFSKKSVPTENILEI